jgi:putative ABC transport system permease protein
MLLKNLKNLLRRYPVAVALNFAGLVCAFVAFALIFLQVDFERSFDRCHPTADRVFRVDKQADESLFRNVFPRGFADDVIASSPEIEAGCVVVPFFGDTYFTLENADAGLEGYLRKVICVSDGFLDVFGVRMAEGDHRALDRPGSVIIPRSLAETLFPGGSALGKLLKTDASGLLQETDGVATVTGVYEDFPANSQLDNDLYFPVGEVNRGEYGSANYICYLLLRDPARAAAVAADFNDHYDFEPYEGWLSPVELVPLTDIYFRNEVSIYKSGSYSQVLLLIAIGVLILIIGLINFTNFYVALTPLRIRTVNLQKILGSSVGRLRALVVGESVLWCVGAFLVAALLLGPVSRLLVTQGVMPEAFSFAKHEGLLLFVGAAALVTGVLAGIWPGVYSTSGQPAMILRGRFGLSASGRNLRSVLVGVQLVVSLALLIFVLFLQRQSRYMQEYPCGFDKANLAIVNIGHGTVENDEWQAAERLRQLPEVQDVAYSSDILGSSDVYSTSTEDFGQGPVAFNVIFCSWNLPEVLGIRVTEGNPFREGEMGSLLVTEDSRERGMQVGMNLEAYGLEVKGMVNNVNITSMRKADTPVAFIAYPVGQEYAYLRLVEGVDRRAVSDKILSVLQEVDPGKPYRIEFYDSVGKNLYSGEERLRLAVWVFSLLAVLLSLVGVWGQVLMDVQYKRMEISVKRVFGAEVPQITAEGLKIYLRTVLVCFLFAAPLGWLFVSRYLEQFSHRVGFSAWVFLLSLLTVSLLCALVVLYHYVKSARSNPALTLKSE